MHIILIRFKFIVFMEQMQREIQFKAHANYDKNMIENICDSNFFKNLSSTKTQVNSITLYLNIFNWNLITFF